jgi:drug/metabolite transporter (DMT)-like permease
MVAILLALASAVGFGASDYAAGLATRAENVFKVTLAAQLASLLMGLLITPWVSPFRLTAGAGAWGVVSGIAGDLGAMTLYLGFRYAAFSVASTLSAVGSAALSVAAGLGFGERPAGLALAGIGLALPAIGAVSASSGTGDGKPAGGSAGEQGARPGRMAAGKHLAGVGYGLAAGAAFALYFVALNRAGSGSGLWPVVTGQVAGVLVLVVIAGLSGQLGLPAGRSLWLAVGTGITGTAGALLYFIATHDGLLAITAVITSLYPAGTIMLARVLLGERLSTVRLAGLALAAGSVALIAVAGALTPRHARISARPAPRH